jgi:hypothetical protein
LVSQEGLCSIELVSWLWAGLASHMKKRNASGILMGIFKTIRSLERSKRRRKNNIKIGIKELG